MLDGLRDLLDRLAGPGAAAAPQAAAHELQLAAAVLLVEVMRSDASTSDDERAAVVAALRSTFELAADQVERLVAAAELTSREATDYFRFTSQLNERCSPQQKVDVIEAMWRVAYADGRLAAHENHLLRKIADLLYVPHGAYIGAKMRAREGAAPR